MSGEMKMRLMGTADTLRWLAGQLEAAAAGDAGAISVSRCFARDWCGMTVFGPAYITSDFQEYLDEGDLAFREAQAKDQDDAEHACISERA